MKTIFKTIFFFCVGLILTGICSAQMQTITIVTVTPTTAPCGGFSVGFDVTGNWGHKNAFTLQLSDTNGSFSSFTNLVSINDTVAGFFFLPFENSQYIPQSAHYRVRIVGANPYVASADNGYDINNNNAALVKGNIVITLPNRILMVNTWDTIQAKFSNTSIGGAFFFYPSSNGNFPGSNNQNPPAYFPFKYSTSGYKTVSISFIHIPGSLCSIDTSITFHIFAPVSFVAIPKYTIVDSGQNVLMDTFSVQRPLPGFGKNIWINPGKTYISPSVVQDTFFCESGSSLILSGIGCVVYLKAGASYTLASGVGNTIYNDSSTSIDDGPLYNTNMADTIVNSPGLSFILTNAPPNIAFPLAVKDNAKLEETLIVPNPTTANITVKNIPLYTISMTVFDVLGNKVMEVFPKGEPRMTLDLSKFESGTYLLRLESEGGIVTKRIVKE